ncbi:MAG: AAA family ATPase, partial [Bacteroidaceae bacterium]|nr:AAA family ATPase [Bacteroidaceae bacterium]
EDNQHQFAATLGMQCKELNLEPRQLRGLKVLFENDDIIEKIERFQKEQHANLVIIDCLNDVLPTQATSAIAIRKFLSKLQHIAEEEHCLIIVSHHTNKYAHNRRPSKYNLIGSPAIEAKCRTVIEMRTDPFQRNYKHLCVVKGNYTPDSEKNRSYMLEFSPQLTFKNTSRRVDIDTLTLMPDYMADRVEKYNRLRSEGLKGDELAKAMGFASRGSLSVWAKKYIKNPQPTPQTTPTSDSQPSPGPKDSNALTDSQPSDSQPSDSQPSPDLKAPKASNDSNALTASELSASELSASELSASELSASEPSDSELSPSPSITSTYPRRPRYNLVDILYPE